MFRPGLALSSTQLILCVALCCAVQRPPKAGAQDLQSQEAKLDTTITTTKGPAFATPPSYLKSLRPASAEEIESAKNSRFIVNKSFGAEQIRPPEKIEHPTGEIVLPSEYFGQRGPTPNYSDPAASGIPQRRTAHTDFALSRLGPRVTPLQGMALRGRAVDIQKMYGKGRYDINDPRLKMLELDQISKSRFEPPGTTPIEAY